jgi:hypothetical protein
MIERLQRNPAYAAIFDDDGSNEAADVVATTVDRGKPTRGKPTVPRLEVDLYHLEYAGGEPGRRLEDLYVVCGQAQRSTSW